jgi:predicted lactoylglutathione lyase
VFDHVTVRVADHQVSRRFYEIVLAPLGHSLSLCGDHFHEWNDFGVAQSRDDRPPTRRLHVAFVARSRDDVDAFWREGTAAGYKSDGTPGFRPEYHADYYGGFLLDPDGNSAEAVYHGRLREGGNVIDHLWIRVRDLEASQRFYETIAPVLGLRITGMRPERFHVVAGDRSFALVRGEPTENVTSPSRRPTTRSSATSTASRLPLATATTARPASGATTPANTARSSWTPTATMSRRWTTTVHHNC